MKRIQDTDAIRIYLGKDGAWHIQPPKTIEKEVREHYGWRKRTAVVTNNYVVLLNALELMKTFIKDARKR